MTRAPLRELAALPAYRALFIVSILVGFREAVAEPYIVLFAVERAHLDAVQLGVFLTARALGAIAASMIFGLWFDRHPSMWPLRLALLVGSCGSALCIGAHDFPTLLMIGAGPLAIGGAVFSQSFALAKRLLDACGRDVSERGIAVLRSSYSIAWGIGPLLGALAVGVNSFDRVFVVAAACGLAALGVLTVSRLAAPHRVAPPSQDLPFSRSAMVGLVAGSFTLFFMTLCMGAFAMPIVLTHDLHGATGSIGVASSLCAALEVPIMLAVAMSPSLWGGYRGLVIGFLAMSLYFVAGGLVPTVAAFVLAQGLRAVGIGLVACIGISYIQELMPHRVGAAAALFTATGQAGALLAGLAGGAWAETFGYRAVFMLSAALCAAGLSLLVASRRRPVAMAPA